MKIIETMIKEHGGIEKLKENYIRVENKPYMRLCIEWVREQHGNALISVTHYYEENGDSMRDPDIVFEVVDVEPWLWVPIFYRQDSLGIEQKIRWEEEGKQYRNVRAEQGVKSLVRIWNQNLKCQGYLEAFRKSMEGAKQ